MKNEGDVKEEVKKILNSIPQCWWYMPVQTGYGVMGIPDFVCCIKGKLIGIEAKFGKNKLTNWQSKQLKRIHDAGGLVLVVNEKNVISMLHELRSLCQ
jgi:hypothetical protein